MLKRLYRQTLKNRIQPLNGGFAPAHGLISIRYNRDGIREVNHDFHAILKCLIDLCESFIALPVQFLTGGATGLYVHHVPFLERSHVPAGKAAAVKFPLVARQLSERLSRG
jgi:hypothetical protein